MLGNTVRPARRHKCELCENIFICHICDIGLTHTLHEVAEKERLIFICLKCANKKGWIAMLSLSGNTIDNVGILYNYKTGEIVRKFKLKRRIQAVSVWRSNFDISMFERK